MTVTDLRRFIVTPYLATPEVQLQRTPLPPLPGQRIGATDSWGAWVASQWADTTAAAHRVIWGGLANLTTGIRIPEEAANPTAARDYLAGFAERLAAVNGWPADDAARRVAAMRAEPVAPTINDTVDRVAAYGPPLSWPGAEAWYSVADEQKRLASLLAAGEAAGVVRSTAVSASAQAAHIARELKAGVEAGGTNVGVGVGLGLVGVAVVGLGVALGPTILANRARRAVT